MRCRDSRIPGLEIPFFGLFPRAGLLLLMLRACHSFCNGCSGFSEFNTFRCYVFYSWSLHSIVGLSFWYSKTHTPLILRNYYKDKAENRLLQLIFKHGLLVKHGRLTKAFVSSPFLNWDMIKMERIK